MSNDEKIILVISDSHMGSQASPMPKSVTVRDDITGSKITYKPNDNQKLLNKIVDHAHHNFPKPNIMVLNGDTCEGAQRKEGGRGNWTNDLEIQVKCVADMMSVFECDRKYVTLGTKYHQGFDTYLDKAVADKLGATFGGDIRLDVNDVRFHFAHFISHSAEYRTTALCKEMNRHRERYDVIVRSHLHNDAVVKIKDKWGVITPGLKHRDVFGITHGMYEDPSLGYTTIHIYEDGDVNIRTHIFDMNDDNVEYIKL